MGKSYYYAVGTDRRGPVDESELDGLVANGTLSTETLVWTDGMANWQPYSTVRGATQGATPPPSSLAPPPAYAPTGSFAPAAGMALDYASFGQRFLAKLIDAIFLFLVGMALGMMLGRTGMNEQAINALGNLIGLLYNITLHAMRGQTIGKIVMKIKVVRPDGANISVGQAIGRALAEILSSCILLIGYIMAAFDAERRALHDRLAGTRVIRL